MAIDEDKIRTLGKLPECLENRRNFAKTEQPWYVRERRRNPSHSHLGRFEVAKTQNCHGGDRLVAFPYVGNVNAGYSFGFAQTQLSPEFSGQRSL
jgi:hypothetical protein